MGNLLTLSIAVAMLLLMSLAVSLNVFVYCLFCVSSVLGPQWLMYVLLCVVQGRLGYWNLSPRLSHSLERYKNGQIGVRAAATAAEIDV
jgi:hypothetical protein